MRRLLLALVFVAGCHEEAAKPAAPRGHRAAAGGAGGPQSRPVSTRPPSIRASARVTTSTSTPAAAGSSAPRSRPTVAVWGAASRRSTSTTRTSCTRSSRRRPSGQVHVGSTATRSAPSTPAAWTRRASRRARRRSSSTQLDAHRRHPDLPTPGEGGGAHPPVGGNPMFEFVAAAGRQERERGHRRASTRAASACPTATTT